jgi:serine/threonine protein kinase
MNGGQAAPTLGPCPHCREVHGEDVLVCPKETKQSCPLEGRLLDGKFRFSKLLGAGGMGAVWKAHNIRVKKSVAIKLMHPEFAGNPGILDRFKPGGHRRRRDRQPAHLRHLRLRRQRPRPLHRPGDAQRPLLRRAHHPVRPRRARPRRHLSCARPSIGLEAAHKVGIVHRDLKPENIFLHEPSPGHLLVKLMDFGISKFSQGGNDGKTGVGVLMGTPEYMSPEQAEGAASADQRTDIWAMGAILYKALTGVEAFGGATMAATLVALSTKEPRPIESIVTGVPPELIAVVRRCLIKDPAGRFQSARELADALAPFEQMGGALPPTQPTQPTQSTMSGAAFAGTNPQATSGPQPIVQSGGTHVSASQPPQATMITGHGPAAGPPRPIVGNPATFVGGNLGAAGQPDDSWSIGQRNDTRPPTITAPPSGGSKAPIFIVVALILVAAGGAAFFMTTKGPRNNNGNSGTADTVVVADTKTPATTAGDTKVEPAATAGATAGTTPPPDTTATAGTTPPPDTTAGATAGTTPPPDTTAGATAGTTPPPGETAGDDDGEDEKPNPKLPPPKPDLTVIAQAGTLFTTKDPAAFTISVEAARAHCATLKKSKFGKLGAWRLANSGEVLKFRDNKDVQKLAYWVSDPGSAGRAKRVSLINASINEGDPKSFTRTRPFCVAKR